MSGGPAPTPTAWRATRRLRSLQLHVRRRMEGLLHGEHLGLRSGPGSEPGEARIYQPGEDDVRHMDWSVTARTTVPHVREPVADRELECWALLDLSASMDFGTAETPKHDVAVGALVAMHALSQRVGDRFGLHVLRGGGVRRWPAHSGTDALLAMLEATGARPRTGPTTRTPDLAGAITDLTRTRMRRGLRVVISDFLGGDEGGPGAEPTWAGPIRRLALRHQVIAVEVIDPRELELPPVGWVTMRDPETGRTREVHLTPALQRRYGEAAAQQRRRIDTTLRHSGVPHLVLRTDRDWVRDIAQFVLQQRRTARILARHTPAVPR